MTDMKTFKYIAILAALFIAASCSETDIVEQNPTGQSSQVQIVGRVLPYIDCNVNSRAIKNGDETQIKNMTLVIVTSSGLTTSYITGSSPVFKVERNDLDSASKIYLFANIPDITATATSIDDFLDYVNTVTGIGIPENGFPMMGEISLTANIPNILEISLSALYAKIVMDIKVTPDQSIEGKLPPRFILNGYTVHNVAGSVDFVGGSINSSNDATGVLEDVFEGTIDGDNEAMGATSVQFSFYLPERFLQPKTSASSYNYPFKKADGTIRPEDENYRQRFKPELVKENNPAATFVRFYGDFIDHQGHNYIVSYDIYVGNDNYSNFDVVRNTQYNNYITIRGIATSNDQSTNPDAVSIDHRVDVERINPIIINLRRETLLDSHFEVRPLRIRKNADFAGDVSNAKVKVEVIYDQTPASNWIGLERSFGDGNTQSSSTTYLVDSDLASDRKNAAGKRKYFTTDLTTNTLASSVVSGVTVPVTMADQCVWIYVDECTEAKDDVRSATIRVSYSNDGTTWNEEDHIDYVINQRMLFPVTFTNGTDAKTDDQDYLIEYHEEYLHNYDADDEYGQTEYEGMKWGLMKAQLSFTKDAILVSKGTWGSVNTAVAEALAKYSPKYDFYLTRDIAYDDWSFENETQYNNLVHSRNGFTFCKEIIEDLKNSNLDTNTDDVINILHLGEDPQSAIEYCYNKNKRNSDGEVTEVTWYLPAIDEMEEIVMSQYGLNNGQYAYSRFTDFQAKMYWSCQPAYKNNYIFVERALGDRHGRYMVDNTERARATSVNYENETGNGANDPNNYEKVSSGMSGYYKYIDADYSDLGGIFGSGLSNTGEKDVQGNETFSGSNNKESWTGNNSHKLSKPSYDKGALSRDDMARVRCVRKAN